MQSNLSIFYIGICHRKYHKHIISQPGLSNSYGTNIYSEDMYLSLHNLRWEMVVCATIYPATNYRLC